MKFSARQLDRAVILSCGATPFLFWFFGAIAAIGSGMLGVWLDPGGTRERIELTKLHG